MNEYDSNRILDLAKKISYNQTNHIDEANCYILNTCHIREKATDKVYHDIGRIKKRFRDKKKPIVLVVGCVAQAEGDILLKKEFDDGSFDTQDVNRHQLESYHQIMKNKAETLSSGSSQPEIFNVLGQLNTIERVKKSGEMIYNKKEQLTNDLGTKPE